MNFFQADTVGRNDRGDIGRCMSLHGPLPMALAIRIQNRLRANGCWIKEQFCPIQSQTASGFWEPLVPTDANPNLSITGLPNLETSVARCEVKFLLIIMVVRDMGLAVDS